MPRSSSSSSDEEDDLRLQQLREVTVTFDSLKKSEKKEQKEKPKSKRYEEIEDDPNNVCDVTPEFQEFVAKKLKQKLDEYFDLKKKFSPFSKIFYLRSIEIISEPKQEIKSK